MYALNDKSFGFNNEHYREKNDLIITLLRTSKQQFVVFVTVYPLRSFVIVKKAWDNLWKRKKTDVFFKMLPLLLYS